MPSLFNRMIAVVALGLSALAGSAAVAVRTWSGGDGWPPGPSPSGRRSSPGQRPSRRAASLRHGAGLGQRTRRLGAIGAIRYPVNASLAVFTNAWIPGAGMMPG